MMISVSNDIYSNLAGTRLHIRNINAYVKLPELEEFHPMVTELELRGFVVANQSNLAIIQARILV